ncbi:MAG TPA: hypothetical protein DCY14_00250 [Anaerolineae bacterium]|nr:hypothetical protein [Anaerolineae bacterium]HRJ56738.1 TRAFs-binding domain-containing protein [Anaerolineales bacterium]
MTETSENSQKSEANETEKPGPGVSLVAVPPPATASPPKDEAASGNQAAAEKPSEPVKPPAQEASKPVGESNPGKIASTVKAAAPEAETRAMRAEVRPHAFVVMPFGKKKGTDGQPFDFNAIYNTLIKPALEEAGFEPFRADEETASGDILTDMFQELLLADMVLCDLSIDNANAFYELGIRHALRKRGVVHIQAGRAYMPFDIFNVRTLPYHITREGIPDPEYIRSDIKAIARMVRDTWASDRDAIHSPIYNLLSGLKEPERKSLQTPLATGFWREYNEWKEKVNIAQRQKHIGDILLLTEEISNPLIREEAVGDVGRALANLGRYELALAQFRKGLEVNSANLEFRREEAFHLNRIGRVDEAIVKIESILADFPNDSASITYLGRIYKEMWATSWKRIRNANEKMRIAFESYHWLIKSVDIYMKGFKIDLNEYYPGINAFTLSMLAVHLTDKFGREKSPDPDVTRIRKTLPTLRNTLLFGLESRIALEGDKADYWTLVSYAELKLLTSEDIDAIIRAYRKAITASRRNLFFLNSSLAQLEIIKDMGLRPRFVKASIKLIEEEISRVNQGEYGEAVPQTKSLRKKHEDGRALLFTGYMVDYPRKSKKVFPPEKENEIRQEIRKKIDKFKPGAEDRAFLAGLSAGSEIIFAELCTEMGLKTKVYLPMSEAAYVREFISPAGEAWVDRFYKIRNHPLVSEIHQVEALGEPKEGDDLHERNNRWALYSALGRCGIGKVRLIAVANETIFGGDRDIALTRHMIELMREMGGAVNFINPSTFIYNVIDNALERLMSDAKPILQSAKPHKKPQPSTSILKKRGSSGNSTS